MNGKNHSIIIGIKIYEISQTSAINQNAKMTTKTRIIRNKTDENKYPGKNPSCHNWGEGVKTENFRL